MTQDSPATYRLAAQGQVASDERREGVLANPGFGQNFTDHMALVDWTRNGGWHNHRLVPYGPLQLMPSASVLHYAQEIFEGMKAYRHADGSIWTFRPERNAARFAASARRLALPELPEADFVESLRALVELDQNWVPGADQGEMSLYLRPYMIATEAFLGVRPADEVLYGLIASPAGSYFKGGIKPVSLWISEHYVRAAVGGTGEAKCGGNYAASLAAQIEAGERGCDQSVFLDAAEHTYIEELGGMNLFFVTKDGEVFTPQLSGSILHGVTRESLLQVAADLGHKVTERPVAIDEWKSGIADGSITEVFACGTAAVITPVGRLVWGDGEIVHPEVAEENSVAMQLRKALLDIQYGRAEDKHGWLHRLV